MAVVLGWDCKAFSVPVRKRKTRTTYNVITKRDASPSHIFLEFHHSNTDLLLVMSNPMPELLVKVIFYRLHSLSSSCAFSNSLWVSSSSFWMSINCSSNDSFSSLHTTLIHFGGLCCLGCLPPKWGCSETVFEVGGSVVEQSPKICVITSSSC